MKSNLVNNKTFDKYTSVFFYILNNFINWFLFGKQILLNYGWLQLVQVASKTFLFLFWQNSMRSLMCLPPPLQQIFIHIALRRIFMSHGFKWQTVSTHLWKNFMSFKNLLENTSHFKSLISSCHFIGMSPVHVRWLVCELVDYYCHTTIVM